MKPVLPKHKHQMPEVAYLRTLLQLQTSYSVGCYANMVINDKTNLLAIGTTVNCNVTQRTGDG
jgi:invasion protein IalB